MKQIINPKIKVTLEIDGQATIHAELTQYDLSFRKRIDEKGKPLPGSSYLVLHGYLDTMDKPV